MSTEINSGSSSQQSLHNEVERLKNELQALESDLIKYKHASDRAIHYKHETRRRTMQRNVLALTVILLVVWIIYQRSAKPAVSEVKQEQEKIPHSHTRPLTPDTDPEVVPEDE